MSGKRDLWFPLYVNDYLGDTMHLTTAQHGAYFLLLMGAWKRGARLPDDDRQLAAIARMSASEWQEVGPILREFFDVDAGELVQKRLADEYERTQNVCERNRNNGALGGRPRRSETQTKPNGNPNETQTETQTEPSQNPNPNPKKTQSQSQSHIETDKSVSLGAPAATTKNQGSRLSPEWKPSQGDRDFARGEGLTEREVIRQADMFRDYWLSKAGANAIKRDWSGAWRNWIRKAAEMRPPPARPAKPSGRVDWV